MSLWWQKGKSPCPHCQYDLIDGKHEITTPTLFGVPYTIIKCPKMIGYEIVWRDCHVSRRIGEPV